VNCRTHEHRHFERTLRVSDSVRNPRLAEGRTTLESARPPPLTSRRTGARGRAQPAVGLTPDRSAAASQVASLNVTLADRAGGVALAASPTRPAGFTAPRRHGPSSRRAQPPLGAGGAVGGGPVPAAEPGGPSNDVGVVPALGPRSRRRELLACPRPASPSTGGAAAAAGESLARPRIR